MTEATRYLIGYGSLIVIEASLGGTLIYVARKRKRFNPPWSWWRATLAFGALVFVVSLLYELPGNLPRFIGAFITYWGLKYLADLSFWRAFGALFGLLLVELLAAGLLSAALEIDLSMDLGLDRRW